MASSFLYPIESATRAMRDLSGIWRFKIDLDGIGLTAGWRSGLPADTIPMAVPSDWREVYTSVSAETHTGAVWYETDTYLPHEWAGRETWLWFEGARCPTAVWVNGTEMVRDAGSNRPFAGSVAGIVLGGQPFKIVVRVSGVYSGIFRSVKLLALPAMSIQNIVIQTGFGGGIGKITYQAETTVPREISVELYDAKKQLVGSADGGEGILQFSNVQIWEPEKPYLYTLRVLLHDGARLLDEYLLSVGVRDAEIRENRVLINRRPFYFKGFCIPSAYSDSINLARKFSLIRWIGANAVYIRWASEEFLQTADREGLLVLCEEKSVRSNPHPCRISLPESVFWNRIGEASPELEKSAMRNWLQASGSLSAPIILSGYGAGEFAGNSCVSCKRRSDDYQNAYLEAQNAVIDDCEEVIGEMLPFFDEQDISGVFTRESQPKAVAYLLQKRWKRLDARTHKY